MASPNHHVLARLTAIQQSLLAHRAGSIGLPTAVAGSERETFLRDYLQQVFPSHRRFTSGVITDISGSISGQIDIAVEFGFSPSFPMPGTPDRLLLAESVALVIEVKSNLSSQWAEVESTTEKVKALRRSLNPVTVVGDPVPSPFIPLIAVGYTGYASVEAIQRRLDSTPEPKRPDGVLVIESGSFFGFGMTATGPFGLYALAVSIDFLLRHLVLAKPSLADYVRDPQSA